jgi:16S rRNA (guanine527-N7)-methyltransferase
MPISPMLESGLRLLGGTATAEQKNQLSAYVNLLEKWSRTYNLVADAGPERIISHHILDSLTVLPYLNGGIILDVGSGAGLPGIPLAIMQPEFRFVLLDSNGKKTRFLQQTIIELGLSSRVETVKSRIEEYHPGHAFDTVISRAFAGLEDFVSFSLHLCDRHSVLLAMKGRYPESELRGLNTGVEITAVKAVTVPGVQAERHIVCLQKISS